ncbi:hypothetical protein Tco_0416863, partial [Tanacetum coccineum]
MASSSSSSSFVVNPELVFKMVSSSGYVVDEELRQGILSDMS